MGPCAVLGAITQLVCVLFAYLHNEPNRLQMNRCASLPGCRLLALPWGAALGGTQQRFGYLLPEVLLCPERCSSPHPLLAIPLHSFLTLPSSALCPAQQRPVGAVCGAHKKQKFPEFRDALKLQGQGAGALFPTPATANTYFGFSYQHYFILTSKDEDISKSSLKEAEASLPEASSQGMVLSCSRSAWHLSWRMGSEPLAPASPCSSPAHLPPLGLWMSLSVTAEGWDMQCQKQNSKTCCAGVSYLSPLQHTACCPVAVMRTGAEWSGGLLGSITAGCTTGDERCIHSSVSLQWQSGRREHSHSTASSSAGVVQDQILPPNIV